MRIIKKVLPSILNLIIVFIGLFLILGSAEENPPTITILGDNPITVRLGDMYVDAGATADDTEDGEVDVVTTGLDTVNTSIAKTYTITYTATDQDGNKATATRIIQIRTEKEVVKVKIIREGKNLVVFNADTFTLYGVNITDQEKCITLGYPVGEILSGEYKKTFYDFNVKGCKPQLEFRLEKSATAKEYSIEILDENLVNLEPLKSADDKKNNPKFKGVCPDANKNKALQKEITRQQAYLNKSKVGIRYFSADACDSFHHDNDPFRLSHIEEVHNLVDLPSHFLYSLEDYKWDNTEKRLKQRSTPFFGEIKVSNGRKPLIIIHGWQGRQSEDTPEEWFNNADSGEKYWGNFIKYMQTPAHREFFAKNYKPYIYHYSSFKRVTYNGRKLKQLISALPELNDKEVTILAHSMGGLVARSWIEEHGGESQLDKLITLATPHHGTPAAVTGWMDSSDLWLAGKSLYSMGAIDLMWDDYDNRMVEYYKDIFDPFESPFENISEIWRQRNLIPLGLTTNFFDIWQLSQFDSAPHYQDTSKGLLERHPNPWLEKLNIIAKRDKKETLKRYYYYASYIVVFGNDILDNTSGFPETAILLQSQSLYNSDAVVPDFSGFFATKTFTKHQDRVFKHRALNMGDYYGKNFSKKWRFIRDVDHDLFRQGLNGKYHSNSTSSLVTSLEVQKKFISDLINTSVPTHWQGDNAYDPLWFMVKQDLGYVFNSSSTGRLNDTGITSCYGPIDGYYKKSNCPIESSPNQDAEYGKNTMSFTKIADEKCIKDNNTGLIWEVKQDLNYQRNDSLHDANDAYSWYEPDNSKNAGDSGAEDPQGNICYGYKKNIRATYCNTHAYVGRVNSEGWCGYSDWRIPTVGELQSIVNYNKYDPAIDTNYFPNDIGDLSWSSSPHSTILNDAWYISFSSGYSGIHYKASPKRVRLVRGGQ